MRVLLCGEKKECEEIRELIKSLYFCVSETVIVDDYEKIHRYVVDISPAVAIVCDSGAMGMESVHRIKESGDVPIFWFSDDRGFAVQSYRLGCSYFGVKPVSAESLKKAFAVI